MIPDAIERDILIEAPVQTVWSVVTEPGQISKWFSDTAELDARPGGEGLLSFTDRATSQHMTVRLLVETVDAHSKGWDAHLASLREYVSGQR